MAPGNTAFRLLCWGRYTNHSTTSTEQDAAMMTATYLHRRAQFPDELRSKFVRSFSYNIVRDSARGYATPYKIVRVSKPARALGDGVMSTVSVSRTDFADLYLTSHERSERNTVQAIKRAAELLHWHDGRESFSQVVVVKAFYLLGAGWSLNLSEAELDICEFAAEQNQAQEML